MPKFKKQKERNHTKPYDRPKSNADFDMTDSVSLPVISFPADLFAFEEDGSIKSNSRGALLRRQKLEMREMRAQVASMKNDRC
jgi:hypothetical protein